MMHKDGRSIAVGEQTALEQMWHLWHFLQLCADSTDTAQHLCVLPTLTAQSCLSQRKSRGSEKHRSTTCAQDQLCTALCPQKARVHDIHDLSESTEKVEGSKTANMYRSHRTKWDTHTQAQVSMAGSKHFYQCFRYQKPERPQLLSGTEAYKAFKFPCIQILNAIFPVRINKISGFTRDWKPLSLLPSRVLLTFLKEYHCKMGTAGRLLKSC